MKESRNLIYDELVERCLAISPSFDSLPELYQDKICLAKWSTLSADEAHEMFTDLTSGKQRVINLMQDLRMHEAMLALSQVLTYHEIRSDILNIQADMNEVSRQLAEARMIAAAEMSDELCQ